ncbi:MAG: Zn-dependent alcohol dehydrogenase [Dehalococcoidia bacterium]
MPTDARVVVVPQEQGPLRVDDVRLPDPGPHQVVVKQFASGVCHSQLHQMHRPRQAPVILGHESTGVVLAKGREVTHVKEGDRVMVTWVPRDGENSNRRPEAVTLQLADGTTAVSQNVFTWADHTIADEQFVVNMPSDVATDVTAIIGCAVMTGAGAVYHTAGVKEGESVAVFGVGGVGLSAITAAAVVGANPIIAVDLNDEKLEFARKFGATHGVNASKGDPVEQVRALTTRHGEFDMLGRPVAGADYTFDCIGVRVTMEQILPAARPGVLGRSTGGMAVLVGVPSTPVELDAIDLLINEKKYVGSIGGSCRPDRDFPMFIRWFKEGQLDLNAMVTARYGIDQINEATSALEAGKIAGRAILEF